MKKVLIDTNIYSLAMKGDGNTVDALRKIDRIGFATISIGELYSGFKGGNSEKENREELNIFLDSPRVVVHPIDTMTADFYASILNNLKAAGTPIPTNDIWIAAVAFQQGYKIFTKDKHFNLIPGLVQL
ncbi:MAG: type II toxin-antitoxin system VapC family toxin [Desulfobacula sp.]|jgi:tRNA(fMet)-specific endonuclease VapC|uniref:type II toxin-antitoxin system VapC family toxin n=1 Tax=Desulfobacula sp. TaxID=2593537 RepID=UPI001DD2718D|nr:type II toxin-antitoxin system VapC family toxin [Desulfobacula sp.]MBT3486013.1 type II toxin-antitoxin system VapC family toxin [Desulfobacula sp.]MBT3804029.1 type II toxin-antitoxin system VapC family toxin [Desulfobacula sp.]MBT4027002.1 type II toxin-antitoxin system VapC family toxin [Desulfobacula sp.]MBT4200582.1 type II toxin-antitoxin system VapC family toxin [Desulfobacula sp.]